MIKIVKLAVITSGLIVSHLASANSPNLLIIQTDEHSFRTLSSYRQHMSPEQGEIWGKGVVVNTPNIDKIANQGAISLNYYASSPVCTPSRASFITGLYPKATNSFRNDIKINEKLDTFAKLLKARGYATSYLGKWHLDGKRKKYLFDISYNAGFDDNRYMMTAGHSPYFHVTSDGVKGVNHNRIKSLPKNEVIHLTDYFTDKALEILQRDKNKPFAMMISFPDPHTPDYARPPYQTMFDHLTPLPPKTMGENYTAIRPDWDFSGKNEAREFKPEAVKQYFGMVKHIDDSVGRLLTFLEKNNLTDNTIVVFTSDHGDMYFEHNRTNKSVPYEAAARIPFVIRYPNKIPAGKVINKAYTTVDFTPTILGLMDVETKTHFQGMNAAADFTSAQQHIVDDRITYYLASTGSWVTAVSQRYKLVLDKQSTPWLFDLQKDPDEVINFYGEPEYKTVVQTMKTELFRQLETNKEKGVKLSDLKLN